MNVFMRAIADETDRFVRAIRETEPNSPVPTCPDWRADDLLWHLTEVHAFWSRILRDRALSDDEVEAVETAKPARPASRAETLALLVAETDGLIDALEGRSDDEPAWFWLDTARTVGAIRRMQAHEALMHRIDAELAAGLDPGPVAPELAADGVDHAFTVMWAWWGTTGFAFVPVVGVVELRATDLRRSWYVQPGRWQGTGQSGKEYDVASATLVDRARPAAAVAGTAAELDRWLWGRAAEPDTEGDEGSLEALREAQRVGMQ